MAPTFRNEVLDSFRYRVRCLCCWIVDSLRGISSQRSQGRKQQGIRASHLPRIARQDAGTGVTLSRHDFKATRQTRSESRRLLGNRGGCSRMGQHAHLYPGPSQPGGSERALAGFPHRPGFSRRAQIRTGQQAGGESGFNLHAADRFFTNEVADPLHVRSPCGAAPHVHGTDGSLADVERGVCDDEDQLVAGAECWMEADTAKHLAHRIPTVVRLCKMAQRREGQFYDSDR